MSLLKVNNPRSILINSPKREKNITINKTKVELSKKSTVVIKVKNEVNKEPKVEEEENEKDADLQMPSELFSCDFIEEKSNIKEIPGEYYFESDHEAIRSNPDYLSLMKTYALLQAKKIQAVKDIEDLISTRTAALSQDPRKFLTKFQAEFAKLPASQNIPDVPNIDWDKYKIPSMTNELVQKPETRNKKSVQDNKPEESAKEKVEGLLDCKVERNARGQFLVRGRVFDASKPQTFNQPWTPEEQRRLEDLLLEYPSEEIEMERWKKIATCLGNRTPIQVQSRVQKYFVKLQKAGLPIPGRFRKSTPGSNSGLARTKRPSNRGKYSNSLIGNRNSSFFPDLKPDVKMTEDDEKEADESVFDDSATATSSEIDNKPTKFRLMDKYYIVEEDVSDEEDIDPAKYATKSYQRLKWLKRIRREREMEISEGSSGQYRGLFVHTGYKCDGCGADPIQGGRFTCVQCDANDIDIDFCLNCAPKGLVVQDKPEHTLDHTLKPVRKKPDFLPTNTADKDYLIQSNYLDPNFILN